MQVAPTEPVLKAPGSTLLKLKHDGPLSNFAFNLKLRRYSADGSGEKVTGTWTGRGIVFPNGDTWTRKELSTIP